MAGRIGNSVALMKASVNVLKLDKELMVFPVMSGVASVLVAGVYFLGEHGWVGQMIHHSTADYASPYAHHGEAAHAGEEHASGTILGMDPHKAMYVVSSLFGLAGIAMAAWLHAPKTGFWSLGLGSRTEAGRSRADDLAITHTAVARWAQGKWYVDEFYDFAIRRPLRVFSHVFHLIDRVLVDGLVDLFGLLPRLVARSVRPSQSGVLHGYALGMVGGAAVLLIVVLLVVA